jgi:hypothetical protein
MTDKNTIAASITLPEGFHFDEVKPLPAERLTLPLDFPPPLGVLSNFQGTFAGKGFNLIFRPQNVATPTPLPNPANGPNDNILELNLTTENLAFSASLGRVPNRGMVQGDIFLNGVPYVQTVNDVTNGPPVAIHFEPGIWLAVPATTNPAEAATFVRMASIPHGTTINLQGFASAIVAGPPHIPSVDPTPFIDATRSPFRFPSQTANDKNTFRLPQDLTSHIANGSITQAILDDPNTVLRNAIAGQKIVSTVTLEVASAPETPTGPVAIPAIGGGNANIAFLTANANVPNQQPGPANNIFAGAKATFWIETVEHEILVPIFKPGQLPLTIQSSPHPTLGIPGPTFVIHPPFPIPSPISIKVHSTQIQYSQVVLLNFNGLTWPHVSVATLGHSTPITPPPSIWEAVRKTL